MQIGSTTYVKSIFDDFWTPAVEAPNDLTSTTNTGMRRAASSTGGPGNTDDDAFEPSRTSEETRREDGGNVGGDGTSDDMDSLTPDDAAGGDEGGDGGDDMGLGDLDSGGDTGGDMSSGGDMGMGTTVEETPQQAISILNLQKNMSQFYKALVNTLDSLSAYTAPATNDSLRAIYTSSVAHLTECKDMMLELLSTDFLPTNYAYKLRKYITLRHVYSTVLEVLNLHFKMLKQETDAKNGIATSNGD